MTPSRSVLQVCQPDDGGVADHVLRLSTGLRSRGWHVEVAVGLRSTVRARLEEAGVVGHQLPLERSPSGRSDARAIRAIRALDRSQRYTVVHAHSTKAGVLVRGALPNRHRLVYTPHCFSFAADLGYVQTGLYRAAEQLLVPRSAKIVAVCDWERRLAVEKLVGARNRTELIYNGATDWSSSATPNPDIIAFGEGQPLAGVISAMRPQKDPLLAVRAMARLHETTSLAARLVLIGNGELTTEVVAEISRLGMTERIKWFPFTADMGSYLSAVDVLVVPSAWEAFPIAPLEAMSAGVPVIATDVGGVSEAVEHGVTGWLVPPRDDGRLAAALVEALGSATLRKDRGHAGRMAYEQRFQLRSMIDAVSTLYEQTISRA